MRCRRRSGSAARSCSCAAPAIRPAPCCRSTYLRHALELAEQHDFVIASDECYAEMYRDESAPPPSLLQAALANGHDAFERCVVFH